MERIDEFFRVHRKGRLSFQWQEQGVTLTGSSPVTCVLRQGDKIEFREKNDAGLDSAVFAFSPKSTLTIRVIPGQIHLEFPAGNLVLEPFFDRNEDAQVAVLIRSFEEEFGGMTSHEFEQLRSWLSDASADLVGEAMRMACLAGKRNFRYIDRILLNWRKANVRTLADVKVREEEFLNQRPTRKGTNRSRQVAPPPPTDDPLKSWGSFKDEYQRRKKSDSEGGKPGGNPASS